MSSTPCQTVQWAYGQAGGGDVIKLAAGTYVNPDMAVEARFLAIDKDLTLAGGYSTSDWETADPLANPTIIDGENLGQLLYSNTSGITITMTGLTLQRGTGYSLQFENARLLMSDCQLINNTVSGIDVLRLYNSDNSQVVRSTISNNYRGLYVYSSDNLLIDTNTISTNSSTGIQLESSNYATLSGNTILGNSSNGVYLSGSQYATLRDNTISGNGNYGFYSYYYNNYMLLENNLISGHTSYGIYFDSNYAISTVTIRDNTIQGNTLQFVLLLNEHCQAGGFHFGHAFRNSPTQGVDVGRCGR